MPVIPVLRLAVMILCLLAPVAKAFQIEQLTCAPQDCRIWGAPVLTADGRSVLFRSTCDLDPGRNPDRVGQVFRVDLESRQLEQVTPARLAWAAARGFECTYSAVSSDGTADRVVVGAVCGLPASVNSTRFQLLEYRRGSKSIQPLGAPLPCAMDPALSADGQHLAVTADCQPGRKVPGGRLRWANRAKLFFQDRPGGPFRRLRAPGSKGCRVGLPRLDADAQTALFASECDLEPGANPALDFQFFRLDRVTGGVQQVNPPECRVSSSKPFPLVIIDDPALTADGETVLFTSGACGTGQDLLGDSHVFRRRAGSELEQLTFGFCVTQSHLPEFRGGTAINPPIAASEDGRILAFTVWCDEFPVLTDQTDHLFVYREDREPKIIELFSQPSRLIDGPMTSASIDSGGSTLALAASGTPGGCPSLGGLQVYLVRNIHDATPEPSTCACRGPIS